MTQFEQMDTALKENHGMLQTSEMLELGISKPAFIVI